VSCYVHKDRETSARCGACNRAICRECDVLLGGGHFCKQCLAEAPTVSAVASIPVQASTPAESPSTLLRSADNRIFFGVLGGISRYFKIDAAILRFVYAATLLGIPLFWASYTRMPGYSRMEWSGADHEREIILGWTSTLLPVAIYLLAAVVMPSERKTIVRRGPVLMRSRKDRIFRGVLSGYSEWFGIDSFLVRIGFMFLLFLPLLMSVLLQRDIYDGLSTLVPLVMGGFYLVNALLLPEEQRRTDGDAQQARDRVV
jgi:phage shock protein PspC (stress-responsive transcriptional regulator)